MPASASAAVLLLVVRAGAGDAALVGGIAPAGDPAELAPGEDRVKGARRSPCTAGAGVFAGIALR